MGRGRMVTLVVVDRAGSLRGATSPFAVDLPWWQETGPIHDVVDDVIVLRLLTARPDGDEPMGGEATYLVQSDADLALQSWAGQDLLAPHPLRMPWAEVGGPSADLDWVASMVELTGTPRQHRTWNLSAIWSIPTAAGLLWLKCVPPFFVHEGVVLDRLDGRRAPELIARDEHRVLMAPLPGRDGHDASEVEQIAMVESLVTLQLTTVSLVDELVMEGVPDLRTDHLLVELIDVVDRLAPDSRPLRDLMAAAPERLAAVDELGLPDTLVHGDPHSGNCRCGATPPVWFDWGDSFVGSPLLDIGALHRMADGAVERWLQLWSDAVPGSDPRRAWALLQPYAKLRMAAVYQRFCDNIEPSEQVYHQDHAGSALAEVEQLINQESCQ